MADVPEFSRLEGTEVPRAALEDRSAQIFSIFCTPGDYQMDWTEIEHKWRQMACRAQGVALSEAHQNAVRTLIPDAPNAGNAPLDGTVTRANTHPGMKSCADPRIA